MKTRLISVSDLHLLTIKPVCRLDDLTEVQWEKLQEIFNFAYNHKADVLIAGDISNISNNYHILNHFIQILRTYKEMGVDVYAVFGQHDMKYRNTEDTNLDIIASSGLIQILGSTPEEGKHFKVYGCEWMGSVPEADPNEINILVVHSPISPAALFQGHHYISIDQFSQEHPEYNLVLCGDVHRTFIEERGGSVFLNSGPLLRKEADEYSLIHKPGFFYIDMSDVKIQFQEVKHRPSSEVISRTHIEKKKRKESAASIADTAHFLDELKRRSEGDQTMNIRDRIKQTVVLQNAPNEVISVLECLLNEKSLTQWLEERK